MFLLKKVELDRDLNLLYNKYALEVTMTKKSLKRTDKKGREETWEWEETPELLAALEQLRKSSALVEEKKV